MGKILVIGGYGQLGTCIKMQSCIRGRNEDYIFSSSNEVDITNETNIRGYLADKDINVIINCAAYTNVAAAELPENKEKAINVNCTGVELLGKICAEKNIQLVHISTDFVFDGDGNMPYKSTISTEIPKNVYGTSKLMGEEKLIHMNGLDSLIVRTSWLYSPFGNNFFTKIVKKIQKGDKFSVTADQFGSPTYAIDLADFLVRMTEDLGDTRLNGIYNFANKGCASWYDFAKAIEMYITPQMYGRETNLISPLYDGESNVQRPTFTVLNCAQTEEETRYEIPHWLDGIRRCTLAYTK